jgi:DNA-binding NarL/FixJ family response regulator
MENEIKPQRKARKFLSYQEQQEVELLIKKGVRYNIIAEQMNVSGPTISQFAIKQLGIKKKSRAPPDPNTRSAKKERVVEVIETELILKAIGTTNGLLELIHAELMQIRNPHIRLKENEELG